MSKDKGPQIRDFYANTQQIADRFNVSIKTIKSWIKKIKLPVIQKTKNSPYMAFEEDIKKEWLPLIKEYFKNKKGKK
jgi:transposase